MKFRSLLLICLTLVLGGCPGSSDNSSSPSSPSGPGGGSSTPREPLPEDNPNLDFVEKESDRFTFQLLEVRSSGDDRVLPLDDAVNVYPALEGGLSFELAWELTTNLFIFSQEFVGFKFPGHQDIVEISGGEFLSRSFSQEGVAGCRFTNELQMRCTRSDILGIGQTVDVTDLAFYITSLPVTVEVTSKLCGYSAQLVPGEEPNFDDIEQCNKIRLGQIILR